VSQPLPLERRREIFRALVDARDGAVPVTASPLAVAEQYGVSELQLRRVEQEAWRTPLREASMAVIVIAGSLSSNRHPDPQRRVQAFEMLPVSFRTLEEAVAAVREFHRLNSAPGEPPSSGSTGPPTPTAASTPWSRSPPGGGTWPSVACTSSSPGSTRGPWSPGTGRAKSPYPAAPRAPSRPRRRHGNGSFPAGDTQGEPPARAVRPRPGGPRGPLSPLVSASRPRRAASPGGHPGPLFGTGGGTADAWHQEKIPRPPPLPKAFAQAAIGAQIRGKHALHRGLAGAGVSATGGADPASRPTGLPGGDGTVRLGV
jgi:hypothetical protein